MIGMLWGWYSHKLYTRLVRHLRGNSFMGYSVHGNRPSGIERQYNAITEQLEYKERFKQTQIEDQKQK